jgi:ABC-type transporter Mla subunit MlaD
MGSSFKVYVDIIVEVGTFLGFLSVAIGWLLTRHDNKKEGKLAISQINDLATNHYPHIQKAVEETAKGVKEGNDKTDKAIEVLTSMKESLAVLVDRTPRNIVTTITHTTQES